MNLMDGLRQFGQAVGLEALAKAAVDGSARIISEFKISTETQEEIQRRLISALDERRVETLNFISGQLAGANRVASANLLRRQAARQRCEPRSYGTRATYLHGDENAMMRLLGKVYSGLASPTELQQRVQMFKWLGCLDDEQFDSAIEALRDDRVAQAIRRADQVLGRTVENFRTNHLPWLPRRR